MKKGMNEFYGTYNKRNDDKERLNTYTPDAFKEIRASFKLPELTNKTGNAKKLKEQQDRFKKGYKCHICGEQKEFLPDTNIMVCRNEECKGYEIKNAKKEIVAIVPSFSAMNTKSEAIASTIL